MVDRFGMEPPRAMIAGSDESVSKPLAMLGRAGWVCSSAASRVAAIKQMRADPALDLVLLACDDDLGESIELCRSIKFDGRHRFLPVIGILDAAHEGRASDLLEAGADDCIHPECSEREMLLRLARAVQTKRVEDSLEDATTVITSLASAIEGKDHYTCGHVQRVASYAVAMGRLLGMESAELATLRLGGAVHDIGKVGVPDHVLNKPGKLTDEEMAVMKRHPAIGHDILQPMRTFSGVLPIVRWHHERPDGTGYPDGISGSAIPQSARIVAVADVFDALATDRPYRPAFPMPKCRAILQEEAAAGHLDQELVSMFLKMVEVGMGLAA